MFTDAHDHFHVVFDQENREVEISPDFLDEFHQFLRFLGIHPCGRLIQQQEFRLRGKSTGDFEPPLGTVGQRVRNFVRMHVQPHRFQ